MRVLKPSVVHAITESTIRKMFWARAGCKVCSTSPGTDPNGTALQISLAPFPAPRPLSLLLVGDHDFGPNWGTCRQEIGAPCVRFCPRVIIWSQRHSLR